ncbi:MAG: Hsp20/alpha crystallin family protein [Deltaproteobacteria bacterium]|nr:MAG: Hsp20/alpha crystallin family protein [Deltaproteobacteria bacterium]
MRWEVRAPWPSIEEIERRFDELIRSRWGTQISAPPADVFVVDDEVWVEVDLPGVRRTDVQVRLVDDRLVIEGTRTRIVPTSRARPAHRERNPGSFRRALLLPVGFEEAEVEVSLRAGVLRARVRRRVVR